MTEEEKKAIESLRKNRGVSFAQADIILNLIQNYVSKDKIREKLEKLKDKEQELTDEQGYWRKQCSTREN